MKKTILIEGSVESFALNSNKFEIVGDIEVSDCYHTFDELYAHRIMLFLWLARLLGGWKSKIDFYGNSIDGWFYLGVPLNDKYIAYHIPDRYWDRIDVEVLSKGNQCVFSKDTLIEINDYLMSMN